MLRKYGFRGTIKLLVSYLFTKLAFPGARIIRLPFDIRNKRYIRLGAGFTSGFGCRLEAYPQQMSGRSCIDIGTNVQINDYVHIAAGEKVEIGNNVLIASKVFISDINHGSYKGAHGDNPLIPPSQRKLSTDPICIKDNVWIGESVCILPGTIIGTGSIIGAMSVVTRNIPDYSIAVGVPAKVIKRYDFEAKSWVTV